MTPGSPSASVDHDRDLRSPPPFLMGSDWDDSDHPRSPQTFVYPLSPQSAPVATEENGDNDIDIDEASDVAASDIVIDDADDQPESNTTSAFILLQEYLASNSSESDLAPPSTTTPIPSTVSNPPPTLNPHLHPSSQAYADPTPTDIPPPAPPAPTGPGPFDMYFPTRVVDRVALESSLTELPDNPLEPIPPPAAWRPGRDHTLFEPQLLEQPRQHYQRFYRLTGSQLVGMGSHPVCSMDERTGQVILTPSEKCFWFDYVDPADLHHTDRIPLAQQPHEIRSRQSANLRYSAPFKLPDEALSLIFEMASHDLATKHEFQSLSSPELPLPFSGKQQDLQALYPVEPILALELLATVRLVCTRWNHVALHTPYLWRYLILPGEPTSTRPAKAGPSLDDVLAHSGGVSLDVYIRSFVKLMGNLQDYARVFHPTTIARIRRLTVQDVEVPRHPSYRHVLPWTAQWTKLEKLTFSRHTMDICALGEMLRNAPNCWSVHLHDVRFITCCEAAARGWRLLPNAQCYHPFPTEHEPTHPDFRPTHNNHVTHLHVTNCTYLTPFFLLHYIRFPKLFHLTYVRPDLEDEWPEFIPGPLAEDRRLIPPPLAELPPGLLDSVKELAYFTPALSHEETKTIFPLFPGVEVLALGQQHEQMEDQKIFEDLWTPNGKTWLYPLPKLHTLLLRNVHMQINTLDTLRWCKQYQGETPLRVVGLTRDCMITNYQRHRSEEWAPWEREALRDWVGLQVWESKV